jgi:uncharacterized membrane protein
MLIWIIIVVIIILLILVVKIMGHRSKEGNLLVKSAASHGLL